MKYKLSITIIVTVVIITIAIVEGVFIKKTFESLNDKLGVIMQQEEYSLADVEEINYWWKRRSEVLEISVSVVQLNEMSVTFGELIGAIENEDYDSASALLNRIYQYSTHICDMYMFKINNIF